MYSTARRPQAEAVDECTEYLVPMPTLVSLAAEFGMALEYASNFTDIFAAEMHKVRVARDLAVPSAWHRAP